MASVARTALQGMAVLPSLLVLVACARPPETLKHPRIVPALRVYTASGLVGPALAEVRSFRWVTRPEEAELELQCKEEYSYRRRVAFPGILVNLVILPIGYFTFAFRCTATVRAEVVATAREGGQAFQFTEAATVSRSFLHYEKTPTREEEDLSPGFFGIRRLARRELGQRIAARLAQEWVAAHPERVAAEPSAAERQSNIRNPREAVETGNSR